MAQMDTMRYLLGFRNNIGEVMAKLWRIEWNNSKETVSSLSELEALLKEINSLGTPYLVVIQSPVNGDSLAVGLGKNKSVLNYISGSLTPPYYTSIGSSDFVEEGVEFDFMGEWSEFPSKNLIPVEAAAEAVRHFYQYHEKSPKIEWEID